MQVQDYLRSGKTLDDLKAELGIKSALHPTLPLAILNYDQIESPRTHPLVRECRGLTLYTKDWSLAARSMSRFFNWGEVQDEMPLFDFSDFIVQTKEDGSLVILYYFEDQWHANTRGSFGLDEMQGANLTWHEGFCKALGVSNLQDLKHRLSPEIAYVCEFCSPWNKVVRRYPEPEMYLLTAFHGEKELTPAKVDALASLGSLKRPQRFEFKSIDEIQDYLRSLATDDPTYEGVVICDKDHRRWKIKNPTYLALHQLRGEGDNIFNVKYLLPFIMAGEQEELLTYFPEVKEAFTDAKCRVLEAYIKLLETWIEHRDIEEQKAFAQTVIGKTPFTNILFNVRKSHGGEQKLEHVKRAWRDAESAILKNVFGR